MFVLSFVEIQALSATLPSSISKASASMSLQEEERLVRRIHAHLTLGDTPLAVQEAEQALSQFPKSKLIQEAFIRTLAKEGNEKKLLLAWDFYSLSFPDQSLNRPLIEEMAWGILQKASRSSSIIMRQMALLAAFFSHQSQGVALLAKGMKDSNYAIRGVAVKLAGHFRDKQLIQEIIRLFKEEKVWAVRQEVIESIGKMKILALKPDLEAVIASDETLAAEKAFAIAALLELLDSIQQEEIQRLSSSNRYGLRQLCCQAIAYFQSTRDLNLLVKLAKDSHPDVRLAAFQALGEMKPIDQREEISILARQGAQDPHYKTALSAIWLLTLYSPKEGQLLFTPFLADRRSDVRLFASAALAATGRYGIGLSLDQFRSNADPFVRLNLALALIGQREATDEAAAYLKEMLLKEKQNWSKREEGLFSAIVNKSTKRIEDSLESPETEDQLLRLELLNLLAILKIPKTGEAIREYLNERSWEVSAEASLLLLTEGDDAAIEIVRQLMHDGQPRIRLLAALILSMWSREESAIQVLEDEYGRSDWDLKARILEGIGRIGSIQSIPFLINVLKEPSQTLRLIAAMALIQCLNH